MVDQVLLFVSSRRKLYKKYIYNVLAYPEGFIMNWGYDQKWVPQNIWKNYKDELECKEAVIIINYAFKREERFLPVRKAKIIFVEKEGSYLQVHFKLFDEWSSGDLDEYDSYIKRINDIPTRRTTGLPHEGGKFILINFNKPILFSKDAKAWENIIGRLDHNTEFSKGIFYRFVGIKNSSEGRLEVIKKEKKFLNLVNINKLSKGFELTEGNSYLLDIFFNFGKEPYTDLESDFVIKSPDLNIMPKYTSLEFRVKKKGFFISSNSDAPLTTMVFMRIKSSNIEGPRLEVPIKIKKSWKSYIYMITIFIGLLIIAISDYLAQTVNHFIPSINPNTNLSLIFSIAGSLITSVSVFFFKK